MEKAILAIMSVISLLLLSAPKTKGVWGTIAGISAAQAILALFIGGTLLTILGTVFAFLAVLAFVCAVL